MFIFFALVVLAFLLMSKSDNTATEVGQAVLDQVAQDEYKKLAWPSAEDLERIERANAAARELQRLNELEAIKQAERDRANEWAAAEETAAWEAYAAQQRLREQEAEAVAATERARFDAEAQRAQAYEYQAALEAQKASEASATAAQLEVATGGWMGRYRSVPKRSRCATSMKRQPYTDRLCGGTFLSPGEELISQNGRYVLRNQENGNLVEYRVDRLGQRVPVWESATFSGPNDLHFGVHGNLCLTPEHTGPERAVWRGTPLDEDRSKRHLLKLLDNGALVVFGYDPRTMETTTQWLVIQVQELGSENWSPAVLDLQMEQCRMRAAPDDMNGVPVPSAE